MPTRQKDLLRRYAIAFEANNEDIDLDLSQELMANHHDIWFKYSMLKESSSYIKALLNNLEQDPRRIIIEHRDEFTLQHLEKQVANHILSLDEMRKQDPELW